jgi:hypothetical protein
MVQPNIFLKTVWYPKTHSINGLPVWHIYFGPIEQTVCPNTTGGDPHKYVSREGITFSHWFHSVIRSEVFFNPEPLRFLSIFYGVMVNYGDLQFAERIMVTRKAMTSGELEYIYSILPSYETCILNRNYPSILHLLANR